MSRHNQIFGVSGKTNQALSPTKIASKVKTSNDARAITISTQRSSELRGEIEHKNYEKLAGSYQTQASIKSTNLAHNAVFWATCFMVAIVVIVLSS